MMPASAKSKVVVGLNDLILLKELKEAVALMFFSMDDLDMKEISNRSKLSLPTLYNLRRGHFSLDVRYRTIERLGVAAGMRVTMSRSDIRISLI